MSERELPIRILDSDVEQDIAPGQLCTILELRREVLCEWVAEGVLRPKGRQLTEWRFSAAELARARKARRLQRDLGIETRSLPLVLDLLGELEQLRRRLRVLEDRYFE